MKTRRHLILALATLAAIVIARSQGIHWLIDIDEAKRQAYFENKFILLLFEYASYDRSARMTSEVWNQDTVISLSNRFICMRVDFEQMHESRNIVLTDKNQKLITRYRITYVPTVLMIDPPGNALIRFTDELSLNEIKNIMRSLPQELKNLYDVLQRLEASPDDARSKIAAGDEYQRLQVSHISNQYYDEVVESDTVKADAQLGEHVQSSQAINFERMGQTTKAIEVFERLLDVYPKSANRPYHLYMLTKLYVKRLREIRAREYYDILKKEFPNSEYTFKAWELLKE